MSGSVQPHLASLTDQPTVDVRALELRHAEALAYTNGLKEALSHLNSAITKMRQTKDYAPGTQAPVPTIGAFLIERSAAALWVEAHAPRVVRNHVFERLREIGPAQKESSLEETLQASLVAMKKRVACAIADEKRAKKLLDAARGVAPKAAIGTP